MSLARALVKNAKIIILDEATGKFSERFYNMLAHLPSPVF